MRSQKTFDLTFKGFRVPLKIYKADEDNSVSFNKISKCCNAEVSYKQKCDECGEEIEWGNTLRGYEIGEDYKLFTKEELKKVKPSSTEETGIIGFVKGIKDLRYLNGKIYYATLDKEEASDSQKKEFLLLREALRQTNALAIVRIVFRSKERLFLVRAYQQTLLFLGLRHKGEVRDVERLGFSIKEETKESHIKKMSKLIKQNSLSQKDLKEMENETKKKVEKLIEGKDVGEIQEEQEEEEDKEIEEKLEASLEVVDEKEEKEKSKEKAKSKA